MRLKVFSILFILSLNFLFSQEKISGVILSDSTDLPLENVTIFNSDTNEILYSDLNGNFSMTIKNIDSEINFFLEGFNIFPLSPKIILRSFNKIIQSCDWRFKKY